MYTVLCVWSCSAKPAWHMPVFLHQVCSNSWPSAFHREALFMSHAVSLWVEVNGSAAHAAPIPHCLFFHSLPHYLCVPPNQLHADEQLLDKQSILQTYIYIHMQTCNMLSCSLIFCCITVSVTWSSLLDSTFTTQVNEERILSALSFLFLFCFSVLPSHRLYLYLCLNDFSPQAQSGVLFLLYLYCMYCILKNVFILFRYINCCPIRT